MERGNSKKLNDLFSVFDRRYKKCQECKCNFVKNPPTVIYRESCECGECGEFLFLDEEYAQDLQGKVICDIGYF